MQPSDSVPVCDHQSDTPVLCSAKVSSFASHLLTWQLSMHVLPVGLLRVPAAISVMCLNAACPIVLPLLSIAVTCFTSLKNHNSQSSEESWDLGRQSLTFNQQLNRLKVILPVIRSP